MSQEKEINVSDQDPFAAGAPASTAADPFATSEQPTTPDEQPAATDAPVVDREGNPVAGEESLADQLDGAQEAAEVPEATPEPQEAVEAPQEPQEAVQTPSNGDEPAAPRGPRGGKGEMRLYQILYQTGETTWEQAKLDPNDQNVTTRDGMPWLLARNNEHALRLGYGVVGRPEQGARILPVPRGGFKPKRVKPRRVEEIREALDIS